MPPAQDPLILDANLFQLIEKNIGSLHSAVAGAPAPVGMTGCLLYEDLDDAYTPTGSFFVASNCRSTYCRIPPFA
jgi:hypothetical protein